MLSQNTYTNVGKCPTPLFLLRTQRMRPLRFRGTLREIFKAEAGGRGMHYTNRRRRQSASLLMRQLPTRARERRALLALLEASLSLGYRRPPNGRNVVAVVEQPRHNHNPSQNRMYHNSGTCSGAHFPRRLVALLELFRCTNIGTENAPSWRDMERK